LFFLIVSIIPFNVLGVVLVLIFGIFFVKLFEFNDQNITCWNPFLLGLNNSTIDYNNIQSVWFVSNFMFTSSLTIFLKDGSKKKVPIIFLLGSKKIEAVREIILNKVGKDLVTNDF